MDTILKPITEERIRLEKPMFERPELIESHPRFCKCLNCREYYGEELTLCAEEGCPFPPLDECEHHFCYRHCQKKCIKALYG